jgi:hypothetical protein
MKAEQTNNGLKVTSRIDNGGGANKNVIIRGRGGLFKTPLITSFGPNKGAPIG